MIELEEKIKKQQNGTIYLPAHFWKWINAEAEDAEICIGLDKNKKDQRYIAVYTKNGK